MIVAALLPWVVWLSGDEPLGPGGGLLLPITAGMVVLALLPLAYGIVRVTGRQTT